jgi:hypothetical protein
MNELESFYRFLTTQLTKGGSTLTPEECLELWRTQHPLHEEPQAGTQAIQEALDDMEAGDNGQSLQEFLTGFRSMNQPSS